MLGHEIGLAHQLLPAEFVAVVDIGEQILDIERPPDIVDILFVYRDTRKTRPDDRLLDGLVIVRHRERRNVHAGFHDLLHLGIHEVDDPRQHHMLLGARTLGHIHGVGQFVERNLALVRRLFADAAARAHQDVGERIENPPQHPERPCRELRETHRHGLCQYFGQYLAEQQQQESHQYGLEQELETQERKNRVDDTRHEDDDADIHQVVDHQNRRQQHVDIRQQVQHRLRRSGRARLQAADILMRQGEKRSFSPRYER